MKLNDLKVKAATAFTKLKLGAKEKSPKLMIFGGAVALVGAGVWACKQTATKLEGVIDEHNENMEILRDMRKKLADGEEVTLPNGKIYTEEQYKKGVASQYIQTGGRILYTYRGPIILGAVGLGLVFGGAKILDTRYVKKATEAYVAREALKEYRQRVRDDVGEEHEKELFFNAAKQAVAEELIDPETGELVTKNETKLMARKPKDDSDIYTYIFDECNVPTTWSKHPGYNYSFLVQMQNTANDYLKTHGAITLYDVLKQLGFRDIPAETMTLGWMIDNPTGYGDGIVDFGICPVGDYDDIGFFKGGSPDYLLNFNCDGDIQAAMRVKQARDKANGKR